MLLKRYDVKIEVMTPFNIASGEDSDGFVDKKTVLFKGQPYIPGSTIKGKIRSNFCKIASIEHVDGICDCPACNIFGGQGFKPSRIYVNDFTLEKCEAKERKNLLIRFGNAMDRYKKTAKEDALFVTEVARPALFTGQITVYFDENTLNYKEDLELAIRMIDSVGNGRSRGYGRVKVYLEEVTQ
nr:MAG: hypothetical protein DIU64_08695 [Caldicoprobacter oshimai]